MAGVFLICRVDFSLGNVWGVMEGTEFKDSCLFDGCLRREVVYARGVYGNHYIL